ncbi:MAG: ATP-grasp domain-containing protein, partial [Acidimicrobiales bacterium]
MPRVVLLVPSATYRASDFMEAAKSLGIEVVVASDHRSTLAPIMGDRALVIDPSRPEEAAAAIAELARRLPIDAAVGVDDTTVLAANLANAALGRPHNPPEAVMATRDKLALRAAWSAAGVPQPRWHPLDAGDCPADVGRAIGWPCVVKPAGLSASRGVIRADGPSEVAAAADRARSIIESSGGAHDQTLVIEEFVPGPEVAVEGLMRSGDLEILAIFDKPDPLDGPFFEETIYVTPSRLENSVQAELASVVARAARALGLVEGPVHAEARLGTDAITGSGEAGVGVDQVAGPAGAGLPGSGIKMLELAARSIGGLCSRTLSFGSGMSLEQVILAHALGLAIESIEREESAAGVMMIPIPQSGVLIGVDGRDEARAVPGVTGLEISVAPGRLVEPLPEGNRYLGFIFAKAHTTSGVEESLRRAHGLLEIKIQA